MTIPLRLSAGDTFVVTYGNESYVYHVESVDDDRENHTVRRVHADTGRFVLNKYEIADMANGGDTFAIYRSNA